MFMKTTSAGVAVRQSGSKSLKLIAQTGETLGWENDEGRPVDREVIRKCVSEKRVATGASPGENLHRISLEPAQAGIIVVPLMVNERLRGVLYLDRCDEVVGYSGDGISSLKRLA
jgi:hypothetical protein